jgi:hypothetical protein
MLLRRFFEGDRNDSKLDCIQIQLLRIRSPTNAGAAYLAWLSRHVKEHLVERDPFAGFAVPLRNRLTRSPLLAFFLLRISARLRARWPLG